MATRGRPTQQKRQRERARQEQRKTKEARRRDAKERPKPVPSAAGGDPDLDGIVAGPQPLSEWQVEGLAEFEPDDDDAEETAGDNA